MLLLRGENLGAKFVDFLPGNVIILIKIADLSSKGKLLAFLQVFADSWQLVLRFQYKTR